MAEHAKAPPETRSAAERLVDALREQGREADIVEIPGARAFRQAVVFPRRTTAAEPTIRVFRGVASAESALRQEPFAMRTRKEETDKDISFLEHARPEVDALADHPTAERLYAYVDAVWPDLNDAELRDFERALREIEDSVMDIHISLRWALMCEQYKFGSSPRPDSGIAPYMPGSRRRSTAKDYGRAAVIVMDLPLSAFESPDAEGDEVSIKGAIKPEHVTAIIVKERMSGLDDNGMNAEFDALMGKLPEAGMGEAEETALLREKISSTRDLDKAQWEHDATIIRERRCLGVLSKFAESGVTKEIAARLAGEWNTDIYTAAKRAVFDAFADRYVAAGGHVDRLGSSTYSPRYGNDLPIARDQVNDEMLDGLRRLVRYMEARKRDFDAYDREREALRKKNSV